jgi:hypothetical protein
LSEDGCALLACPLGEAFDTRACTRELEEVVRDDLDLDGLPMKQLNNFPTIDLLFSLPRPCQQFLLRSIAVIVVAYGHRKFLAFY